MSDLVLCPECGAEMALRDEYYKEDDGIRFDCWRCPTCGCGMDIANVDPSVRPPSLDERPHPLAQRVIELEDENARLRKIARQMFSCIGLGDMYYVDFEGDPAEIYHQWGVEFANFRARPAYDGPTPPSVERFAEARREDEAAREAKAESEE